MNHADFMKPNSRQALKKYILANNKTSAATPTVFDVQFNKALRSGVEKGEFTQPKGKLLSTPPFYISTSIFFTARLLYNLLILAYGALYLILAAMPADNKALLPWQDFG